MCTNCAKTGETCDYSIRLNWGGRSRKDRDGTPSEAGSFTFVGSTPTSATHSRGNSMHDHVFSAQHLATTLPPPPSSHPVNQPPTPELTPGGEAGMLDPRLRQGHHARQLPPQDFSNSPYTLPPYLNFQPPPSHDRSPPTSAPAGEEFRWSPQHGAKRQKLNPAASPANGHASPVFAIPQYPNNHTGESPGSTHFTPHSISSIVNTPATPGSSINSASPYPIQQTLPASVQDPPDLRRLSVKSLLSEPSEEPERPRFSRNDSMGYRTYGYDHGFIDLDTPHNDDGRAIQPKSPDLRRPSAAVSEVSSSSGEPDARQIAFEPGGYYAQPVPVKIPRFLEPLPAELQNNSMNLLYFHHFINHTGRILVPHDCPENPYRSVLPQMAVRNRHLLHLMLAYSASHRARLLNHEEPANRIAAWMEDVIPALQQALVEPSSPGTSSDPTDPSSLAPLATAIMLASLEIVSPKTFAVSIPWQQHLQIARRMIISKGGLDNLAQKADGARDKAIFFLSRWFAYLDVLGSLSGGQQDQPLFGAYAEDGGGMWLVNRSNAELHQIDCFFGFSGRCIALLARVAELAAQSDRQRVDPVTRRPREGWQPPEEVRAEAEDLASKISTSATSWYGGCQHVAPASNSALSSGTYFTATNTHRNSDPSAVNTSPYDFSSPTSTSTSGPASAIKSDTDIAEIYAVNEAFHFAGLIHLHRRVLGRPPSHPDVQSNVRRIVHSLSKIRRGSSAESNLLFPIFSGGCEALGEETRGVFKERLQGVEGWGMQQFVRARELMERVWQTGRGWEELEEGEFFG